MLPRILEPEVMDTIAEAEDYNAMDHSHVNRAFVDDFLAALQPLPVPTNRPWRIFDAGTGTALIPIELVQRGIPAEITASDLAEQMLIVARRNIARAGFDGSIRLIRSDCKSLADGDATFDAVISNSIVHHIPEPVTVLRECWRILRPGGLLFFRDLLRPRDDRELDGLVQTYAGTANDHGRQMFRDSLHAALTVEEVAALANVVGMANPLLRATSDRHWTLAAIKP
jgi:ubiquinone/menaquinone biosynthesis C-methylase UbiE